MTDCNNANCVLELYLSRPVAISLSFQFEGTYGCGSWCAWSSCGTAL